MVLLLSLLLLVVDLWKGLVEEENLLTGGYVGNIL